MKDSDLLKSCQGQRALFGKGLGMIEAVKMPQPRHAKIPPQPQAESAWRRPGAAWTFVETVLSARPSLKGIVLLAARREPAPLEGPQSLP